MRKVMELVNKITSWDLFFELITVLVLLVAGVIAYLAAR